MEYDTKTPTFSTADKNSLAYESARDRWPIILTGAIDDVHKAVSETEDQKKLEEGKQIIAGLSKLKYELQHDRALTELADDGQPDIARYNEELKALRNPSWFNAPWLFSECYLYRRLAIFFSLSQYWTSYDVFSRKKISTFHSSRPAVLELASQYQEIVSLNELKNSKSEEKSDATERSLFFEMCEVCLWGNATDLSLLTVLTYEDIQKLQGSDTRKSSQGNILINDLVACYDMLQKAKNGGKNYRQVDIILDNAGFELYVDLVLAGFLLSSNLATSVILHPKSIPWFVSDVISSDFNSLLSILANPQSFYSTPSDEDKILGKIPEPLSQNEIDNLSFVFKEWNKFYTEGKLSLRTDIFWTEGGSYWRLPVMAPQLYNDLQKSELVIFKGDLNYRKLTGDAIWNPTTSFSEALGPLGSGSGVNILSLRTCKSDVIVGLKEGEDERLRMLEGNTKARKWAWTGKWAIMSFSSGK